MPNLSCTLLATLAASIMLAAMAGAAVAGPYEDGVAAYVRGDYATALRLMRPFAYQGMAAAQNISASCTTAVKACRRTTLRQ